MLEGRIIRTQRVNKPPMGRPTISIISQSNIAVFSPRFSKIDGIRALTATSPPPNIIDRFVSKPLVDLRPATADEVASILKRSDPKRAPSMLRQPGWSSTSATFWFQPLHSVHWLPIDKRIDYKLCLLVHKASIGQTPTYIADMLTPVSSVQSLSTQRSATNGDYIVPRTYYTSQAGREGLRKLSRRT